MTESEFREAQTLLDDAVHNLRQARKKGWPALGSEHGEKTLEDVISYIRDALKFCKTLQEAAVLKEQGKTPYNTDSDDWRKLVMLMPDWRTDALKKARLFRLAIKLPDIIRTIEKFITKEDVPGPEVDRAIQALGYIADAYHDIAEEVRRLREKVAREL